MTKPLIRRDDAPKAGDIQIADGDVMEYFREASWEEALEVAANGLQRRTTSLAKAASLVLVPLRGQTKKPICSRNLSGHDLKPTTSTIAHVFATPVLLRR